MTSVLYEEKAKIAYITLNRPDKLNSISAEMLEELQETWKISRVDEECKEGRKAFSEKRKPIWKCR